jgi:hypothetical protein
MPSLPWFKWLVSRWRNCKPRLLLSRDERLLYLELLFALHEWNGAIPDNPQQLAMLAAFPQDAFDAAWPAVSKLFVPHPSGEPGTITNLTALEIIEEQAEKYERTSRQRRGAAKARWSADRNTDRTTACLQKREEEVEEEKTLSCSAIAERDGDSLASSKPRIPSREVISKQQQEWFISWWEQYWRKTARAAALRAFGRHIKTQARFDEVLAATKAQSAEMLAREERHRPQGATWLNGERWTDEAQPAKEQFERIW